MIPDGGESVALLTRWEAAAVRIDNKTGARAFRSTTESHCISFRLYMVDECRALGEGVSAHMVSHSCLTTTSITSWRVASRKVGFLKRVHAVYNGFLYLVLFTIGLYGEWIRHFLTILLPFICKICTVKCTVIVLKYLIVSTFKWLGGVFNFVCSSRVLNLCVATYMNCIIIHIFFYTVLLYTLILCMSCSTGTSTCHWVHIDIYTYSPFDACIWASLISGCLDA